METAFGITMDVRLCGVAMLIELESELDVVQAQGARLKTPPVQMAGDAVERPYIADHLRMPHPASHAIIAVSHVRTYRRL